MPFDPLVPQLLHAWPTVVTTETSVRHSFLFAPLPSPVVIFGTGCSFLRPRPHPWIRTFLPGLLLPPLLFFGPGTVFVTLAPALVSFPVGFLRLSCSVVPAVPPFVDARPRSFLPSAPASAPLRFLPAAFTSSPVLFFGRSFSRPVFFGFPASGPPSRGPAPCGCFALPGPLFSSFVVRRSQLGGCRL